MTGFEGVDFLPKIIEELKLMWKCRTGKFTGKMENAFCCQSPFRTA